MHDEPGHVHGPGCNHDHGPATGSIVSAADMGACTADDHADHPHFHDHAHGPGCGHEAVQHGDHTDYVVDGRLHHTHEGHCDDHGPVEAAK